ncbi:MAG: carbamoyl-phosphate synthase large subunit [Myxococcota bacterium]|jgi:carbamoyl-phosphate synthase large subunit
MSLTIAVTGLNATDNPAPGVAVIRAIRDACPDCTIVGLAYDALDPGNYMDSVADHIYLMPYPSAGAKALMTRLMRAHETTPIDVIVPSLDSELSAYIKLQPELELRGIKMFIPTDEQLKLRGKDRLHELADRGVSVPKGKAITDPASIATIDSDFDFPLMVKGQFYDAYVAYSPMEVRTHFERIRSKWGLPVIIQQYVTGEEFDIAAVGDGEGGLVGAVAMRKMQLTDKGKAWGGVTVADERINTFVKETMARLKWRGPCEFEVMSTSDGGELYLIEINPRFPAWIYLSVGAGRNLPWATVELALGRDVEHMSPAPAGIMFLRHSMDQICTMTDFEALATAGELHRETTTHAA